LWLHIQLTAVAAVESQFFFIYRSAEPGPTHIYLLKIKVDQVDRICATDLHLINLAKRRIVIFPGRRPRALSGYL
jgi:hypothetical protein